MLIAEACITVRHGGALVSGKRPDLRVLDPAGAPHSVEPLAPRMHDYALAPAPSGVSGPTVEHQARRIILEARCLDDFLEMKGSLCRQWYHASTIPLRGL